MELALIYLLTSQVQYSLLPEFSLWATVSPTNLILVHSFNIKNKPFYLLIGGGGGGGPLLVGGGGGGALRIGCWPPGGAREGLR